MAQTVKNPLAKWETPLQSLGWEAPLEEDMATHSSILPGESHGQRSLAGYSPRDRKELDMTERLSTQSLFNRFCDEEWAPKLTADGLWDNEMPRWDTHWTLWTHCSSHHHWAHWVSHSRIKLHPLVYSSPTQITFKEYTYLIPRKFLEPQNNLRDY